MKPTGLSKIAQLAARYDLQAMLDEHSITIATRHENYSLFYHPDGRLWSHGFVMPLGSVSGPPWLLWAINTMHRLYVEKSEVEFPAFKADICEREAIT